MQEIFQFISDQMVIIVAIIVVLLLILQEFLSDRRGSAFALSPDEAAVLLFKGAKLIDIRDKESFSAGHIKGAMRCNINQVEMYPEKVLRPKRTYIIYCSNGNQSGELSKMLREKSGYNTYYIADGITAWQNDGLDLTKN